MEAVAVLDEISVTDVVMRQDNIMTTKSGKFSNEDITFPSQTERPETLDASEIA